MPAPTRVYLVATTYPDSEAVPARRRLVRAINPATALRHVVATDYRVAVASQDDLIALVGDGIEVETAGESAQAEPAGN